MPVMHVRCAVKGSVHPLFLFFNGPGREGESYARRGRRKLNGSKRPAARLPNGTGLRLNELLSLRILNLTHLCPLLLNSGYDIRTVQEPLDRLCG